MDTLEMAKALLGGGQQKSGSTSGGQTTTAYGTAVGDSADGKVMVDFGGETSSYDDEQAVEVDTTFFVKDGDQVIVSLVGADGTGKAPVVTGVVGRGDETQTEIKSVTNYFWHDAAGAHVSTQDHSVAGNNVLLDSDSLDIRFGNSDSEADQTVLASFGTTVTVGSRDSAGLVGAYSHVFGQNCIASGSYSHAEGKDAVASGNYSHAEAQSFAGGNYSHSEAGGSASGAYSHAEGTGTASNLCAHAEGDSTEANGKYSHAEGYDSVASGDYSHAEGSSTASGKYSHSEGTSTASGEHAHAEGFTTNASGVYSHSEGQYTVAAGKYSHAEGYSTEARGERAHTEGSLNVVKALDSHAEGNNNKVYCQCSHAEGMNCEIGVSTWAETYKSAAHAEGRQTYCYGNSCHSEGMMTIARADQQHVQGRYNVDDTSKVYADIIGNGSQSDWTDPSTLIRSNAYNMDWNGNAEFQGSLYEGGCTPNGETPYPVVRYNTSASQSEYWSGSAWTEVPGTSSVSECTATMSSSQTITSTSATTLNLSSITGSGFTLDANAHAVVIPAGCTKIFVTGSLYLTTGYTQDPLSFYVRKNGVNVFRNIFRFQYNYVGLPLPGRIISVSQGDKISLAVQQNKTGASVVVSNDSTGTWLTILKIA